MCVCVRVCVGVYLFIIVIIFLYAMNDLTKTFICLRRSFLTQPLYEHLHKCVEFYIYIYVMSDISSHDSISMIFSFSLLKTWHCVEHLMSGITNLFSCRTRKGRNKRTRTILMVYRFQSEFYQSIINIQKEKFQIHIILFFSSIISSHHILFLSVALHLCLIFLSASITKFLLHFE